MARHVSIDAETDFHDWDRAVVALQARMYKAAWRATQQGMYVIERNVKMYLRTFTHPFGTKTPSPPGGPPALVFGNLRRSWRNTPVHEGRRPWTIEAHGGPTAVQSRIQELGGWTGRNHASHLPKRPYVRPMMKASRHEIRRIYVELLSNAIRSI